MNFGEANIFCLEVSALVRKEGKEGPPLSPRDPCIVSNLFIVFNIPVNHLLPLSNYVFTFQFQRSNSSKVLI